MKKIKFLCALMLCFIFMPKVYAFTYDLELNVDNTLVSEGAEKEIKVILKNVEGLSDASGACSMNIQLFDNVTFNGTVSSLDGWNVTSTGNFYSFETSVSFVSDSEVFIIPVKINNAGSVRLTNIECSVGDTKEQVSDKAVSFTISELEDNSDDTGADNNEWEDDSLFNIVLSEGDINFDPEVTEYNVTVSDFDSLEVEVNGVADYSVDRTVLEDGNAIVVNIFEDDGSTKIYTIYINEDDSLNEEKSNNKYTPIFIGIICVLVLINIFRIVRNIKK